MADKIEVSPTPIQRNEFDVAMELTQLYWERSDEADIEKIDTVFARFYAVARLMHFANADTLRKYVTDDFKK